ncbi:ParB N-terminal domain-containing protein [Umezawaea sp. Da 62-37]|uniref:ParB/RepB/Spo0J family partition protein n=1 Tax=Umezawaea sp. Da 62-37 TaxID=3075927 RepID=UPI0028F727EB|nr:ParB N-terminal domain-containing protein [Umezawaea sp. Da 62-37]WNV85088.1 ParB N-terminal domain-containing protein [Umezawaea sp. Da 62-37]
MVASGKLRKRAPVERSTIGPIVNAQLRKPQFEGERVAGSRAIRTFGTDSPNGDEVWTFGDDVNARVERIPISVLVLSGTPRTGGVDDEHIRTLAEPGLDLPPIVVQRGTNRVVDGVHRVRAAQVRGEPEIRACFFDGDDESAFMLAVRLNVRHGLPLSLADRKVAAARILRVHTAWSNRAIASVSGLSHKTIAALRLKDDWPEGQARVGRDGRTRPLSAASGRECAKKILERDPTSSLRDVSAIAGVSPGTVRDVRDRLLRQDRPVIPSPRRKVERRRENPVDAEAVLRVLRADPSLRLTQSGRQLLSILAVASMGSGEYERLVVDLPAHCVSSVAKLAEASVRAWQELSTRLEGRRSTTPVLPDCFSGTDRRAGEGRVGTAAVKEAACG